MNLFLNKDREIKLDDFSKLHELSNKWNVSLNDLTRAIVETGSLNIKRLKAHIKNSNNKSRDSIIWMYQGMRIIR
ncbi:MAG: hypothetical protein JNL49_09715 [Bacteroidia bacterium]|jgi:hypothetical protein|nr:hypothetical protein [Bacteroidia bacterium]